jgi:hypothetical protein
MFDAIVARLLDWYSIVLLLSILGSMFSFARFMQQARINADKLKTPKPVFSVFILAISGYYLYCKVFGLSKHDLSLISVLLHLGGNIFLLLLFTCAAMISKWLDFGSGEP